MLVNSANRHRPLPTTPVGTTTTTTTTTLSAVSTMHPCCLTMGKILGGMGLGLVMLTVVYSWVTRTWNLLLTLMVIGAQVMCVVGFILYRLGYPSVPNNNNNNTVTRTDSSGGGNSSTQPLQTAHSITTQTSDSAFDNHHCVGMPDAPPSYDMVMSNDRMYPKTSPGMLGALSPPPTPPPVYSDTVNAL